MVMPSRPGPSPPLNFGSVAQTSREVSPGASFKMCGWNDSATYTEPSDPTTMSLQSDFSPGNGQLPFPAPVLRSNAFSATGFTPAGGFTPNPDRLLEHTQSVPAFSSASTPSVFIESFAPGLIHCSAVVAPGATRKIPPSYK